MNHDPRALEELERRGPENVRALLASLHVGFGQGASVPLGLGDRWDPTRSDVEGWLREKDETAKKLSAQRHEEQLTEARKATRWARAAFWVVLVSALGAIAFGIFDHLPKLL